MLCASLPLDSPHLPNLSLVPLRTCVSSGRIFRQRSTCSPPLLTKTTFLGRSTTVWSSMMVLPGGESQALDQQSPPISWVARFISSSSSSPYRVLRVARIIVKIMHAGNATSLSLSLPATFLPTVLSSLSLLPTFSAYLPPPPLPSLPLLPPHVPLPLSPFPLLFLPFTSPSLPPVLWWTPVRVETLPRVH